MPRIIITASSFCQNQALCREVTEAFPSFEIVFHPLDPNLAPAHVARSLDGFDAAIVGRERISTDLLRLAAAPRVIAKYGVGMDNIDPAIESGGIGIIPTPGSNAFAVAEHTMGLVLALTHNIARCDRLLRAGQWWKNGGVAIAGRRVAVIGVGHVGSRVAALCRAFGCEVVGVDLLDKSGFLAGIGARQDSLLAAVRSADIVTLHVPLTPQTAKLVDCEFLAGMKSGAFLVNTCRGEVVVEKDLLDALNSGRLAGAGLDVFELEPAESNELINHPAIVCTPHIAGNSVEAVLAMGRAAIAGLQNALIDNRTFQNFKAFYDRANQRNH